MKKLILCLILLFLTTRLNAQLYSKEINNPEGIYLVDSLAFDGTVNVVALKYPHSESVTSFILTRNNLDSVMVYLDSSKNEGFEITANHLMERFRVIYEISHRSFGDIYFFETQNMFYRTDRNPRHRVVKKTQTYSVFRVEAPKILIGLINSKTKRHWFEKDHLPIEESEITYIMFAVLMIIN